MISGDYVLTITHRDDEYAIARVTVTIPKITDLIANPTTADYPYSIVRNIDLYSLNAGVKGKVYKQNPLGELLPADGITVIARYTGTNIEPNSYQITTGDDGSFLFDMNLPVSNAINLFTMPFSDSLHNYGIAVSPPITLFPDIMTDAGYLVSTISVSNVILLLSPYGNDDFPVTDNIDIVFSKALDSSSLEIELENNFTGDILNIDYRLQNQNIALEIDPILILNKNTTYNLTVSGMTLDNSPFTFTGSFDTEADDLLNLIQSNIYLIDDQILRDFPVDGNIELTFNNPIERDISSFQLWDIDAIPDSIVSTVFIVSDNVVTVYSSMTLEADNQYRMSYVAEDTYGNILAGSIDFFTEE
jgi:hypothetical protein